MEASLIVDGGYFYGGNTPTDMYLVVEVSSETTERLTRAGAEG